MMAHLDCFHDRTKPAVNRTTDCPVRSDGALALGNIYNVEPFSVESECIFKNLEDITHVLSTRQIRA